MASAGALVEGERAAANGKRAERILQRVIQPDVGSLIGADARCVGTATGTRGDIVILPNPVVSPRLSRGGIDGCNGADPALGPPDPAIRGNGDQMRSQTGARSLRV